MVVWHECGTGSFRPTSYTDQGCFARIERSISVIVTSGWKPQPDLRPSQKEPWRTELQGRNATWPTI